MIKAVLFDLDGTLADTAIDLGEALNQLRRREKLDPISIKSIRPVASHGSKGLLKLGFNLDESHPNFQQWKDDYLYYYEQCFTDGTKLFSGVFDLIDQLVNIDLRWGIITNKPEIFTNRLIPKLGFSHFPQVIVSGDTTGEAKPSTKPMFYACERLNVLASECLYVGDAQRDIEAGRNAGMITVLAEWGYIGENDDVVSWNADKSIAHPLELLDVIHEIKHIQS